MKARFANAQRQMWPGTFVNVTLVPRTLPQSVVIPAQAIVTAGNHRVGAGVAAPGADAVQLLPEAQGS